MSRLGWDASWKQFFGIFGFLVPTFTMAPAISAERIYLSYGILERSVSVDSVETFVNTGEINDELKVYARRFDEEQLEQLRQVLQSEIPLDAVTVSQFLYTPIGEQLLSRLSAVVQTEARQPGFYGIRAALILAANDPQGFTPLSVLRQFPTNGIRIDVARSLAIADDLQTLVSQTDQSISLVRQQATTEAEATPLPARGIPPRLEYQGYFAWEQRSLTFNDRQRNRTFVADVYIPVASSPRPMIVISHGLGSDRLSFAYLAQHLASHGFAVVVPEHPGSNADQLRALFEGTAQNITSPREFVDRPLDITYLLNELERLSQADPNWQGLLNFDQVGIMGHSYGGYTALALAGAPLQFQQLEADCNALDDSFNLSLLLQCLALQLPNPPTTLADPRIKAAIAIDPLNSSIMGPEGLGQIQIPTMIVSGSADTITPALLEQIQPFTWLTMPDKYLVLIEGGTHFSTVSETPNAAISIPDAVIGPNPALARRYMRTLSLAFFQTHLANQASYEPILSAAYTRTMSQFPLPLRLVESLDATELGSNEAHP